jgi:sortase B
LGTLFSLAKTDYRTPGKNIAIYGHHIRSNGNVMFSPLLSYKKQSFYAGHETIYLDSLYRSDTYIVFAVINMRSGDWNPSAASFASDDDFLGFIHRARSQSLYETGVTVTAKDQILTLITCDRSYIPKAGRLVVMAVKRETNDHQQSNQ